MLLAPTLYSYVAGNPVDATDPSGAVPALVAACAGDAIVNTVAGALLGRKHTAGDYLRGLAKGCADGLLMFGVGKFLSVGLRSVRPAAKALDEIAEGVGTTCRVGPRSFTGETLVLMADGTTKPISEIKVGDEVLATDPDTGEQGPHRVTALFEHPDDVVDLDVNGEVVTTTEDHPFWNATDHRFEEAQHLDRGDQLQSPDGHRSTVGGLRLDTAHTAQAYNLTVEGLHTYYVLAGTRPILVHNTDGAFCGIKNPISSDEISAANRVFEGARLRPGGTTPQDALINAGRLDGFFQKAASLIRNIAGDHMFDNGNKRTAYWAVNELMVRNNIMSGPTSDELWRTIMTVSKPGGSSMAIDDIAAMLRGY